MIVLLLRARRALVSLLLWLGGGLVATANRLAADGHVRGVTCITCVEATVRAAYQRGAAHGYHLARHPQRPVDRVVPEA